MLICENSALLRALQHAVALSQVGIASECVGPCVVANMGRTCSALVAVIAQYVLSSATRTSTGLNKGRTDRTTVDPPMLPLFFVSFAQTKIWKVLWDDMVSSDPVPSTRRFINMFFVGEEDNVTDAVVAARLPYDRVNITGTNPFTFSSNDVASVGSCGWHLPSMFSIVLKHCWFWCCRHRKKPRRVPLPAVGLLSKVYGGAFTLHSPASEKNGLTLLCFQHFLLRCLFTFATNKRQILSMSQYVHLDSNAGAGAAERTYTQVTNWQLGSVLIAWGVRCACRR